MQESTERQPTRSITQLVNKQSLSSHRIANDIRIMLIVARQIQFRLKPTASIHIFMEAMQQTTITTLARCQ